MIKIYLHGCRQVKKAKNFTKKSMDFLKMDKNKCPFLKNEKNFSVKKNVENEITLKISKIYKK